VFELGKFVFMIFDKSHLNPHSADVIHVTGIFEKSNPSNFFSLTFLTLVSTFCEN